MELTILGTSCGTPTKTRNVSAAALKESRGSAWYLVDCGEGTQHQILRTSLSLRNLSAIFITHIHGDHCFGLPGLLASAAMSGKTSALKIVAPEGIRQWFEATQKHTALNLPFDVEFCSTETLGKLRLGQFDVGRVELSHRVPSFAYSFTEAEVEPSLDIRKLQALGIPRGPIWGAIKNQPEFEFDGQVHESGAFLIQDKKARKVIICGDNDTPERLRDASVDCDLLVHEATYTQDLADKVKEFGHSYAQLVASFAQSAGIPNLVLTHFSPRYHDELAENPTTSNLFAEAKQAYSGNVFLANDFDHFELNQKGTFRLI